MDRQTTEIISANIRRLIKEKNTTQEKLAVKCGVSKGTISNYVNCRLGNEGPTDTMLTLIANGLGVPKESLFAEIKDPIIIETTVALKEAHAENIELESKLEDAEAELADKEAALAHNEAKLEAKETKLSELTKQIQAMQTAVNTSSQHTADTFTFMRRSIKILAIALAIVLVLLIVVTFYAGFAFFAFDMFDPTKGIIRG